MHEVRIERLTPRATCAIAVIRAAWMSSREDAGVAYGKHPFAERLRVLLAYRDLPSSGRHAVRKLDLSDELSESALVVRTSTSSVEFHVHGNELLVTRLETSLVEHARAAGCHVMVGGDVREPRVDVNVDVNVNVDAALRTEVLDAAKRATCRVALEACLFQLGAGGLLALLERGAFDVDAIVRRSAALDAWLEPRTVVLTGKVNAGKSTLFNLMVGRSRTRTGTQPGLTRDTTSELVLVDGMLPIRLIDVAGEREVTASTLDAELERMAIASGRSAAKRADLVVRLVDARDLDFTPAVASERAPELLVHTHADVCVDPNHARLAERRDECFVSLTKGDAQATRRLIGRAIRTAMGIACPEIGPAFVGPRTRAAVLGDANSRDRDASF